MNPLLDGLLSGKWTDDPDKNAAIQQGLLTTGLSLLASRGPAGQAFGNAGLTGVNQFSQLMQQTRGNKLRDLQMQAAQQQLANQMEDRKRQQMLRELPQQHRQSTNPEAILAGGAPNKAGMDYAGLSDAYAAQGEFADAAHARTLGASPKRNLTSVAPGGTLVDEATGLPVFSAPQKEESDEFARALKAAGIDPASPSGRQLMAARLQKLSTHAPPMNVTTYGSPVPVQLPDGGVGYVQPGNKQGAPPQLMTGPGGPLRVPPSAAETKLAADASSAKKNASEVLSLLNQAEKLIPSSTGSYTGTAADKAAQVLGFATKGGESIAKLRAIEGALMAKMPRMEGPQSNYDVQLYRQSAGQIGDSTTPRESRLAAIKAVREIQSRYAGVPEGKAEDGADKIVDFGSLP